MKIVCIGAGRLAHHLMPELQFAGHTIIQVYNRTHWPAVLLSQKLHHADHITRLEDLNTEADFYFLTIADDAISGVAGEVARLHELTGIVVHCSGVTGLEILPSSQRGIFYPLQTFSEHHEVEWSQTPVIITSDREEISQKLHKLARTISSVVYTMDEEKKSIIHLAAVFANNFTNHLITLAEDICKKHDVPFEILKPLIYSTFQKAIHIGPSEGQTGPAIRGDEKTIQKHLALLEDEPEFKKIYQLITESIMSR